jgi:D-glycero-D-manno-heptose 1,7-bisphosphate phosphatase
MHKFLTLDRDGVMKVDFGYVGTYQRFEYQPYIKQILRTANYNNFEIVIATNQSGIARGLYTINAFEYLMEKMNRELVSEDLPYHKYWYCPHHKDGIIPKYSFECTCRKPNIGMLENINKYKKIDK